MKEDVLSLGKAAEICTITRWTLWSYVKSGELKASRTPGGHYRVTKKDLYDFIHNKGMETKKESDLSLAKIMVVDDDPKIREFIIHILETEGNEVVGAADGFEAGQKSIKFKPDIMIVDIFMPNMDGFEVCTQMRRNHDTMTTNIIAISGYSDEGTRKKILDAGADLFIPKPLSRNTVIDAVSKLSGISLKRINDIH